MSHLETEAMRATETDNQSTEATGRALIPLAPAQSHGHMATAARQPAGFLAQLIATQQSLPQTRERRRIDPQIGAAIYAEAGRPAVVPAPHVLLRAA
jgi:hypothetical protein